MERHPHVVAVREAQAAFEVVRAAGGAPRAVFPITYAELVRVTGGAPAVVA